MAIVGILQATFSWNRQFSRMRYDLQTCDREVAIQRWEGRCRCLRHVTSGTRELFRVVACVASL